MLIAILQFEVEIPGAVSLKDKRRVVKSIKDRFHRDLLCAVAEVAQLENPAFASLALAVLGTDRRHLGSVLDKAEHRLRSLPDGRLLQTERRIVSLAELEHTEPDGTPVFSQAELDRADNATVAAEEQL